MHLGLLHLLDPSLYRWEDLEPFRQRLSVRRELARAMFALDPEFPFLLPDALNDVRERLPADRRFEALAWAVTAKIDAEGNVVAAEDGASLARAVEAVRGHVGETYRLHRRVIRHRRATIVGADLDDEALLPAFEVTGRRRPKIITLSSLEHQGAVRALEEWQATVRDAALDTGTDPAPYAAAFAVLASRTGGPADDLREALRWRLTGDEDAARAADLSKDERRALGASPVQPTEHAIASSLDDLPERDGLAEIIAKLAPMAGARAVIFAGAGSLAEQVARDLVRINFAGAVRKHISASGAEESEAAVTAWRDNGGVLVCDSSADDGRNLQHANLVVHLRLPANPNALEQRIGRVDRYGSGRPAQQVVFGDETATVGAAWRGLLLEGYQVFDRSISALQDAVARDVDAVWGAAILDGADGIAGMRETIEQRLRDELRSVAQLDMLEASYDADSFRHNLALDIARYEFDTSGDRDPLLRLVGGDDGFRMSVRQRQNGCFDVEPASSAPLMSPRLLSRLRAVPVRSRSGFTDRWAALQNGGRLFRIGNPLVDAVGDVLQLDDRGRASAHWRVDPSWLTDPLAYFGFVYLVEADVSAAQRVVGERAADTHPARRRADRALAPFIRSVWIPADTEMAVEDQALLAWLEAPYQHSGDDVNLSFRRVAPLHALFGGQHGFADGATAAESTARIELARVTDLRARCDSAAVVLRNEGAVLAAQAEARGAAGRLLDDDESLVLDRALSDALVTGIEVPTVQLIAVTCLVRSSLRWSVYAS
jgi:ATP-dependent helicase HepA